MAYTNRTPNFQLPQYIGTDKPTYMGDFNSAMSTIDLNLYAAKTAADTASEISGDNATAIGNINGQINTINTEISGIKTNLTATTTVANNANTLATGDIGEPFNVFIGVGNYISSNSPNFSTNTIIARVITMCGIDYLSIFGETAVSYTGLLSMRDLELISNLEINANMKKVVEGYGVSPRSLYFLGNYTAADANRAYYGGIAYNSSSNSMSATRYLAGFDNVNARENYFINIKLNTFIMLGYKN